MNSKQRRFRAKIKEVPFFDALRENLMNQKEFSNLIGSKSSHYISNLMDKKKPEITASTTFVKRILNGFKNKYSFPDLFKWVD